MQTYSQVVSNGKFLVYVPPRNKSKDIPKVRLPILSKGCSVHHVAGSVILSFTLMDMTVARYVEN